MLAFSNIPFIIVILKHYLIILQLFGGNMAEFTYDIQEQIGVLSQNTNGWSRQINKISWNGREPKYDIRDWAPNNEKMGKGISLSMEELQILKDILNSMDI